MAFVLADAVSLDFSTVAVWLAGILATVISAGVIAACGFAWNAAMALRDIRGDMKAIRADFREALDDIEDHENRLRTMEGRPLRTTRKDRHDGMTKS